MNKLILGDCLDILSRATSNSVDAVVTDPPYHLVSIVKRFGGKNARNTPAMETKDGGVFARKAKGFMGKEWDGVDENGMGIANNKEMWAECLRVLKPGGHLLAFGGTRTYHRMAVAIEDAGFEVRDMIEWVYGSGFPKSLNIGKAVARLQGEDIPKTKGFNVAGQGIGLNPNKELRSDHPNYVKPTYDNEWEGWGTALKPSHETIAVAQKPLDSNSDKDYTKSICQTLFAQIVEKSSELNLSEKTQQGIVQWTAEKNINTLEDLLEVMGMLQSESVKSLSLNIVLSWLNILADLWEVMNTLTIKTELNLTTELKILQSLEWVSIFQNITQAKDNQINGLSVDVLNVENLLNAVRLKLTYTLTHSAQEDVMLQGNKLNFAPNHEPICMARKPLAEKTVAENVLKWGTGGINIEASKAGTETTKTTIKDLSQAHGNQFGKAGITYPTQGYKENTPGRFPANLLHDNSEEVRECFPNESERFFKSIIYQAKASKSERNKGCEGLEEKDASKMSGGEETRLDRPTNHPMRTNHHPTVKPIALMEYLIKMVTPKGGTVLDPFMGSGSTGVAAIKNNYSFIGIELELEYLEIAKARIDGWRER